LAGKFDMAALLTDIQISPTLTTCRVLHNASPIILVDSGGYLFASLAKPTMADPGESLVLLHKKYIDSGGYLFASLAEPTMADPGESLVLLHKKYIGAVFAKVMTAPENSPAPIINQRVDVSVTNGGSPLDTDALLDVLLTDSKKFDNTSKQTMHFKRVRFADADKVVDGLPHFSEHVLDDEFVPDRQPNDGPLALPKNLAESVKSSFSISLADLPKMHRILDHPIRSQFAHVLRQALNVDTLPEDLQNAANLVHDHCFFCVKNSRPVPRPRVSLPSFHQPEVCAFVDYGYIHHPSRGKAFRVLISVCGLRIHPSSVSR
jgi:hypothetical protein